MDVSVPSVTLSVGVDRAGRVNITGLEEFSSYEATVTPDGGRESSTVDIFTLAGGKYLKRYLRTFIDE